MVKGTGKEMNYARCLIIFFNIFIAAVFASFSISCFALPPLQEMTIGEKVGQLLMVHFQGEKANEDAKILIQKLHVGGIIYYNWANGLHSPEQVLGLSVGLQKLSATNHHPIPLFIAVDQEGGRVARLTQGFTIFPGNQALGMTGRPEWAEESAFATGEELHAVGVNFNLAPVVDIHSNPKNPVIGSRSFGNSADIVILFGKNALLGYHRAGIITSLKHFPGHGDVEIDSHQNLPIINKSKQQLQKVELFPFSELASQADTVMTAHILVPSIDSVNCVTLSKEALDILRKEIGFQGVIISDSLVMEGLLKNCSSVEDAAIRALNAGCDIILLGGKQLVGAHAHLELTVEDVERIHQALVHAVKNGIISEQRLDEAVQRILNLKNKYDLSISDETGDKLGLFVNTPEHQLISKKIEW
jgi:beta-N-acetylhexosaminidase